MERIPGQRTAAFQKWLRDHRGFRDRLVRAGINISAGDGPRQVVEKIDREIIKLRSEHRAAKRRYDREITKLRSERSAAERRARLLKK